MIPELAAKYRRLLDLLRALDGAVVAYSGGVDSTLLLRAASEALGPRCRALLAISPTYPDGERAIAVAQAEALGVTVETIHTDELDDPAYTANHADRCYHCKKELWRKLAAHAAERGLEHVLDGSNVDDRDDYRPGARATAEHGVRSPLAEVGLTKQEIRALARELGLACWDKPQMACLASRVPYETPIDPAVLRRIDAAEQLIRARGFAQVRVRFHDPVARIELEPELLPTFVADHGAAVAEELAQLGFAFVTVDLRGYRTGSLNQLLGAGRPAAAGEE